MILVSRPYVRKKNIGFLTSTVSLSPFSMPLLVHFFSCVFPRFLFFIIIRSNVTQTNWSDKRFFFLLLLLYILRVFLCPLLPTIFFLTTRLFFFLPANLFLGGKTCFMDGSICTKDLNKWTLCRISEPEVGIYKWKKESKETRKHAFDQESDQEKKKKNLVFLIVFLVGSVFSFFFSLSRACFLSVFPDHNRFFFFFPGRFLDRKSVFFPFLLSCFLL